MKCGLECPHTIFILFFNQSCHRVALGLSVPPQKKLLKPISTALVAASCSDVAE